MFFCETCDNAETCLTCKANTTQAREGNYCRCPEGYFSYPIADGDLECYPIREKKSCLSLNNDE